MKTIPIIILHGWGKKGHDYEAIQTIFEKHGFTVFAPTMPGSDTVPLTKEVMKIDDYVDFVLDFLKKNDIKKAIFICHSFGGRVMAKLARRHPEMVEKLILTGSPLIKQQLSVRKKILVMFSRIGKKLLATYGNQKIRKFFYFLLGEWDYYKAPENIRKTFKAIVSEDMAPNLPDITSQTLVLWGGNDTFVSPKIGKEIAKRIPHAIYMEVPGATHKLPYEEPEIFAKEVLKFIDKN